jgi:hypothetical protein
MMERGKEEAVWIDRVINPRSKRGWEDIEIRFEGFGRKWQHASHSSRSWRAASDGRERITRFGNPQRLDARGHEGEARRAVGRESAAESQGPDAILEPFFASMWRG